MYHAAANESVCCLVRAFVSVYVLVYVHGDCFLCMCIRAYLIRHSSFQIAHYTSIFIRAATGHMAAMYPTQVL